MIVSPEQRLLIDGPEVEYLFEQEAVLVPARHLVNGVAAMYERSGPIVSYSQLLLPAHETMIVAGAPLKSMFIGQIRRDRALAQSSVLGQYDLSLLPEHEKPAQEVLQWYDAVHLASRRAA